MNNRPFWWFQGAAVSQLVDRLIDAGAETARLEVHLDGTTMTFLVVPAGPVPESHTEDHINDSHVCPPSCP